MLWVMPRHIIPSSKSCDNTKKPLTALYAAGVKESIQKVSLKKIFIMILNSLRRARFGRIYDVWVRALAAPYQFSGGVSSLVVLALVVG